MALDSNILNSIVGSGMLFPIEFTVTTISDSAGDSLQDSASNTLITSDDKGWYPVKGDLELINNNLKSLVAHHIGQRLREEDFGTRLWECLEEPNTQAQAYIIDAFMKSAFAAWEERIVYDNTELSIEGSTLKIQYTYHLNGEVANSVTDEIDYDHSNNTLNI